MARRALVLDAGGSADPIVGTWLSALADSRRRTLDALADLPPEAVDGIPGPGLDAIGTLLYHVAAIEADWLFEDILGPESGAEWPADVFPFDVREQSGRLTVVSGVPLADHLARLEEVRDMLVGDLRVMDAAEFHRSRTRDRYDVSPAWVAHHLLQHEAEHRAQISAARQALDVAVA